jgi:serine/threonine protein kinase
VIVFLCGAWLQSLRKLLHPETFGLSRGTPEFNAAAYELLEEARLLHSLRHENVVQLRGVTMHPEHGHVQWLVTEYANGGSLEAWVTARGRLSLEELRRLLRSIMSALVYLHSRTPAVLHRDVKPANVLVFNAPDGGIVWKLGDVGIAKVLQSTQHARTGAGTPLYTAPDVHMGPYNGKVDVFSTGIMAAELVVRHVDVDGFERVPATTYQYPEHRPALVDDACARLDAVCPSLSAVVRSCCAMEAANRMNSGAALGKLNDAVAGPSPAAAAPVQLINMSDVESAMRELGVDREVSDRVCDAIVVADGHGRLPGAHILQIVIDEGRPR